MSDLEQFSDATLTRCRYSHAGLWYAVIDHAPAVARYSWLDFSTCSAVDEATARRICAQKIRDDARGVGKYAPHHETRADTLAGRDNRAYWRAKQEGTPCA